MIVIVSSCVVLVRVLVLVLVPRNRIFVIVLGRLFGQTGQRLPYVQAISQLRWIR
jgi:hypothetical protein